jgi:hypothetical protein
MRSFLHSALQTVPAILESSLPYPSRPAHQYRLSLSRAFAGPATQPKKEVNC